MEQTTALGYPHSLKDTRVGSAVQVEMDQVMQILLRTTCTDGFQLGVEVGRKLAEQEEAKKKKNGEGGSAKKVKEAIENLQSCSKVFSKTL